MYLFTFHFSGDVIGGKSDNGITGKKKSGKSLTEFVPKLG